MISLSLLVEQEEPYGEWVHDERRMANKDLEIRQKKTISVANAQKYRSFILKKFPELVEVIVATLDGHVMIYLIVKDYYDFEQNQKVKNEIEKLGKYFNAGHNGQIGIFIRGKGEHIVDDYGEIFLAGDWKQYSRVYKAIQDRKKDNKSDS